MTQVHEKWQEIRTLLREILDDIDPDGNPRVSYSKPESMLAYSFDLVIKTAQEVGPERSFDQLKRTVDMVSKLEE